MAATATFSCELLFSFSFLSLSSSSSSSSSSLGWSPTLRATSSSAGIDQRLMIVSRPLVAVVVRSTDGSRKRVVSFPPRALLLPTSPRFSSSRSSPRRRCSIRFVFSLSSKSRTRRTSSSNRAFRSRKIFSLSPLFPPSPKPIVSTPLPLLLASSSSFAKATR